MATLNLYIPHWLKSNTERIWAWVFPWLGLYLSVLLRKNSFNFPAPNRLTLLYVHENIQKSLEFLGGFCLWSPEDRQGSFRTSSGRARQKLADFCLSVRALCRSCLPKPIISILTNVTLQRELCLSDSRLGHGSPFSPLSLSLPSSPPLTFIPFLHQVLSTFLNTSFLASWAWLSLRIVLQDSLLWAGRCKALFLHPAPTRCLHIHREGIPLA